MRQLSRTILFFAIMAAFVPALLAKDAAVAIGQCPAPVQAVIKDYSTKGTFESVALDEKKKSGGPAVYEAKFVLRDGKRIEVHISPEGKVMLVEEKKPKS